MTAVAITDTAVNRPPSDMGGHKSMTQVATRPASTALNSTAFTTTPIKITRDPKAMVEALNQSSSSSGHSLEGFNPAAAVAQLAMADKANRMMLEDALVSQGGMALPAVLNGLLDADSMVRSRCAFVVIRMGRSVAGQALVDFSSQHSDSRPLHVAVSLIADQWGGELLAA